MIFTIDAGQIIPLLANLVVIIAGTYGLWRYLRRKMHEPPSDKAGESFTGRKNAPPVRKERSDYLRSQPSASQPVPCLDCTISKLKRQ